MVCYKKTKSKKVKGIATDSQKKMKPSLRNKSQLNNG